MPEHIAIVGGGHSGATLALSLRDLGFVGRITIFGAEAHPPYQRPPLSKKYLTGEWNADRLYLRDDAAWKALKIDIRCNAEVEALDPVQKSLRVAGEIVPWDKLALTTGAASRPMPPQFAGRPGVYDLRSIRDVDALRETFRPGGRLAIVGGGFIGLETAAAAIGHGLQVTLIEKADRILERAVGPETSRHFRALHESRGVRILEASAVRQAERNGQGHALSLEDGTVVDVDIVLIGIGVVPVTGLAESAGLAVENGVRVDEVGRTSAPDIWAAGDCASFPYQDRRLRLESVQNAVDHAKAVAADMLGGGKPYQPVPWFWSDQYDTKLQIAGLTQGSSEMVARKGRMGQSHWYFRDDQLIAVEAINEPAAFMTGRKLLEANIRLDAASMADASFDPRSRLG